MGHKRTVRLFSRFALRAGTFGRLDSFAADEWVRGISMFLRWRSRVWEKAAKLNYQKHLQQA